MLAGEDINSQGSEWVQIDGAETNESKKALDYAEKALKVNPGAIEARILLTQCYYYLTDQLAKALENEKIAQEMVIKIRYVST